MAPPQKIPVLSQPPPKQPVYQHFLDALKEAGFEGDIGESYSDRLMQSTDNSVYQVMPEAVIYPKSTDDVQLAFKVAQDDKFHEVTFAPRGGGTGTNGQSLTSGLVVDTSRFMGSILEVNTDERWARLQPGVVLDQLNDHLADTGLFFAPNLSPSSRATVGGMCNTDACGKGSRVYGRTSDHLLVLDLVLGTGEKVSVSPLSKDEVEKRRAGGDPLSSAYDLMEGILTEFQKDIEGLPSMNRGLTGYNLSKLRTKDGGLNLNYLIAGSEGTLAMVTELKVKLTPVPKAKELFLLKYLNFDQALRGARDLVSRDPSAIETIDDTILGLAREDILWHQLAPFFSDGSDVKAINLVEFEGNDGAAVEAKAKALQAYLESSEGKSHCDSFIRTSDPSAMNALWSLRKKGVGLLGNRPGARRPIAFVEDTAVPPEHLADYIKKFRKILDDRNIDYGMFGHVDVGCLHVRPALNLKDPQDEAIFREISDEVKDLVMSYKGVMWGEHGRGFRSEYTEEFFGPTLYQSLRRIKQTFDPRNILNPGKIVAPIDHPSSIPKIDEVGMRGQQDRQVSAALAGEFQEAMNCNGNGACFNYSPDYVMCPSAKITRNRIHSPKGRSSLIREWLRLLSKKEQRVDTQNLRLGTESRQGYDFSHEVYDGMDGCLGCKACATQCPIKVDVPEMKSKFLELYHSRYRRPMFDYLIARGEESHRLMVPFALIYNVMIRLKPVQSLLKSLGMVDPPRLSSPSIHRLRKNEGFPLLRRIPSAPLPKNSVIVLQDPMTSFYEAPLVIGVLNLLRRLGFHPYVADFKPNGKGYHVKGFRQRFKKVAETQSQWLEELFKTKAPVIGIDPAITLTYREEYPQILDQHLSKPVLMLHEWLADQDLGNLASEPGEMRKFTLFSHCGEQTSGAASQKFWLQIFKKFGHDLEVVQVGCCGMAGAYGHDAKHQEESRGIFESSWAKQIQASVDSGRIPLATGASCRSQCKRFGERVLKHPLEVL